MQKGNAVLKGLGYSCLIILGLVVIIGAIVLIVRSSSKTKTDSWGNVWQKYKGSKSKPTFTVFAEECGKDSSGRTSGGSAHIFNTCDPMNDSSTLDRSHLTGDYSKGIAMPNHCAVANDGTEYTKWDLDFYLLLADGSIISADGSTVEKIQVNTDQEGTTVVQSDGKAYYRIQQQTSGKKFVIRAGSETFTATGTEAEFDFGEKTVSSEENVQVMVVKGSLEGTSTQKGGSTFTVKQRQKAKYPVRWQSSYPPTITPMDVEAADPMLADKFFLKQITFSYMQKISWEGQTQAQLTQSLGGVITAINIANQQALDASFAEAKGSYWDAFIKGWVEDDKTNQDVTGDGSGSGSSGSSDGSSSGNQSNCPPSNVPKPSVCYSSSKKNGQYWCDSGNLSGWWKEGCIGSARMVN